MSSSKLSTTSTSSKPVAVGQSARRQLDTSSTNALQFLLFFAALVAIVPLSVYFVLVNYVLTNHKREWAALAAALSVNVVLFVFVIMANRQESSEGDEKKTK